MPHIDIELASIPVDRPLRLEHGETAIVVIRTAETITAFHDLCPHAHWRLSDGEVNAGVLECPGHGWEFATTTGQCLNAPAYRLKAVAVLIDTDCVRIEWEQASPDKEKRPGCQAENMGERERGGNRVSSVSPAQERCI